MFAYHTPTRMKGSAVVQGLKSWASALHPQLPLNRKESQRLLNALTSSFRRQLDEAHPPPENGASRPQLETATGASLPAPRSQSLHSSSAVYADRHLASVLTNPLLGQAASPKKPGEADVAAKLKENPDVDPIKLLEAYHAKGQASIPIAIACLEAFSTSLQSLGEAQRKEAICETLAGKRVLLWLWQSKVYESEQFVQDVRLAEKLVPLVIEEGLEKYLWEWLAKDLRTGDARTLAGDAPRWKARLHPYRWKGLLVRGMVASKLTEGESFDATLETLFRATRLENASRIPFAPATIAIRRGMRHDVERTNRTSVELYDRFCAFTRSSTFGGSHPALTEYDHCWLQLNHPANKTPLPALALLRRIWYPHEHNTADASLRTYLAEPKNSGVMRTYYQFFVKVAAQLEALQRFDDAGWVAARAKELYPQISSNLQTDIRRERDKSPQSMKASATRQEEVRNEERPDTVPMPSFAT